MRIGEAFLHGRWACLVLSGHSCRLGMRQYREGGPGGPDSVRRRFAGHGIMLALSEPFPCRVRLNPETSRHSASPNRGNSQ